MSQAYVLQADESRTAEVLNIFGDRIRVKVRGADTDGRLSLMEDRTEPQAGPPLHRHQREDEWFFILDGEFRFEVDGEELHAGAGCTVFAPKGTAHTFQNSGTTTGRMLVMVQPAGLEEFFSELSAVTAGMAVPEMAVVVPVFEKYGLELLGPPLAARTAAAAAN